MTSQAQRMLEMLIIEAASLNIAVDEFEEIEGEDNAAALSDLQDERDQIVLSLLSFVSEFGSHLTTGVRESKMKRALERASTTDTVFNHEYMRALRGE